MYTSRGSPLTSRKERHQEAAASDITLKWPELFTMNSLSWIIRAAVGVPVYSHSRTPHNSLNVSPYDAKCLDGHLHIRVTSIGNSVRWSETQRRAMQKKQIQNGLLENGYLRLRCIIPSNFLHQTLKNQRCTCCSWFIARQSSTSAILWCYLLTTIDG